MIESKENTNGQRSQSPGVTRKEHRNESDEDTSRTYWETQVKLIRGERSRQKRQDKTANLNAKR